MKAIATDAIRSTFLKLDPDRKHSNFEVIFNSYHVLIVKIY